MLVNPRAEFSFWTLPESCRLTGSKTLAPPLGLITAAALLPDSWDLRLRDLNIADLTEADWDWADLVMMTGMLSQRTHLLALVREAKALGKRVVLGGPYPTSLSEEVLDAGADFLVRGEAENSMDRLLAALAEGKEHGVFEDPEKPDMTASPVPRFDLLHVDDYQFLLVQTSRGCPFNCEFCDIVNLYGRKPRYKAPDQVIEEFETLYQLGWRRTIFVGDDNFIGNKIHARAILERIIQWQKSRGEPFGLLTQASVNLGQDVEMIDLLTAANFGPVFIGIESPDEDVLERSRKYQNVHNPLAESVSTINRNGLIVYGSFIMGFDGERKGADDRICKFVEDTNLSFAMINTMRALPNTSLWDRLKREGRLLEDAHLGEHIAGSQFNFIPTRPEEEIVEEFVRVWDRLYEPGAYFARTYRYLANMRPTRKALGIVDDTGSSAPKQKRSFKESFYLVRGFLLLLWLQGIRPSYRWQFWKYLFLIRLKNPSRFVTYIHMCGLGENMFRIRESLRRTRGTAPKRIEKMVPPASSQARSA